MKKKLTIVVSLLLVMALSIGGTLAYLTAKTDAIENTFTIGDITLELKEYIDDPDVDGVPAGEEGWLEATTDAQKKFKVVPGGTASKKPVATIGAGSENCYLYVLVTNNVKVTYEEKETVVASVNMGANWVEVPTAGDATLYRYNSTVTTSTDPQDFTVFDTVTYSGAEITAENFDQINAEDVITVDAFAHQAANVDTATADTAAIAHFELVAE